MTLTRPKIEEVEASLLLGVNTAEGLALSDLEETLDSILQSNGHADSWELSAALAKFDMSPDTLASLLNRLDPRTARAALVRIAASAELSTLLRTIENSTTRMSNLVRTVKDYTNMDQGPVHNVDVARSLETTLGTLAHGLQPGINGTACV